MDISWRALQVMTNHEKRVAQHLTARSLDHYLPLYMQKSKWTDRTVTLERPLFPGYVFVRFFPAERVSVVSTPGVLHLVGGGFGDAIPTSEIERIRIALALGISLRPHPRICTGMRVRIVDGIFEGVEGIVTELRQQCRVVLALSAVEQCFSLEARIEELEVVESAACVH